jgi:Calcium-activated chloride channel N terminal
MFTKASAVLFSATHQRLFFGNVTILVPANWTTLNASWAGAQTFDTADVIVAPPNPLYGDVPFANQPGGCGDPGLYIHYTPAKLLNTTMNNAAGTMASSPRVPRWGSNSLLGSGFSPPPVLNIAIHASFNPHGPLILVPSLTITSAKQFVQKWAQYRYGVFEEDAPYPTQPHQIWQMPYRPFYEKINQDDGTWEWAPTACTDQITGRLADQTTGGPCTYDSAAPGYPDYNCRFYPDAKQSMNASLMYSSDLDDVGAGSIVQCPAPSTAVRCSGSFGGLSRAEFDSRCHFFSVKGLGVLRRPAELRHSQRAQHSRP